MKTFEQLNDQELTSLTQEQIDFYIKLKKAETGIKIIALPDAPEQREVPAPDLEIFEVSGMSFTDRARAEEIAAAINKHITNALKVTYDYYRAGSDYQYAKPYEGSLETVEVKRVYSMPVYNSIKDIIASNKKVMDAWKEVERECKEEDEKASEIVDAIYDSIAKARERLEQFRNYKVRIVEYLQLANGDRDIAWNFFDKAYTVEPSVKNMIMESEEYQNAINSYINA